MQVDLSKTTTHTQKVTLQEQNHQQYLTWIREAATRGSKNLIRVYGKEKSVKFQRHSRDRCAVPAGAGPTPLCFQISGLKTSPTPKSLTPLPVLDVTWDLRAISVGGHAQIWPGTPDAQPGAHSVPGYK